MFTAQLCRVCIRQVHSGSLDEPQRAGIQQGHLLYPHRGQLSSVKEQGAGTQPLRLPHCKCPGAQQLLPRHSTRDCCPPSCTLIQAAQGRVQAGVVSALGHGQGP